MKRDIEKGRINCVITKDLSRLGRNYSMTGYYTDEYFPEQNVRYIAINDGVDTMGNGNDYAAFHNVINEFYPKEISKKVRQVKRSNAEKGMFMGSRAPYGYKKSPADKHRLIVDEEVAHIVRRIFTEVANGNNYRRLAGQLNVEDILSPMAYYYCCIGKENPRSDESMLWGSASIKNIISNQVYLGHMVQGCREVVSFKSKKRRVTDPEEWIVVENTHEAIVNQRLWNQAQSVKKSGVYYRTPTQNREVSIFAGLVRCADCGSSMGASLRGPKPNQKLSYHCSRYANHGKEVCSTHNIREEVLEAIVRNDIRSYAQLAEQDRKGLIGRVLRALRDTLQIETDVAAKQLARAEQKAKEIDATVKSLFKEKIAGKIPETFFYSLLTDYEKEKAELEVQIPELKAKVAAEESQDEDVRHFVNTIAKYISVEQMDRFMARELIESITVSETYKENGKTMQDVTICYKFVGNLDKLLENKKDAA
ncbi:MAG: recombinase family protein [Clostridiales bacterium]|nr:recombinase family protein [Clostridiales bacterium]